MEQMARNVPMDTVKKSVATNHSPLRPLTLYTMLERGRAGLRQAHALWKFKCGMERCRGVSRLLCGAQQLPTWA